MKLRDYLTEMSFAQGKKRFGITTDFREAGWILPDGIMLDFSGKNEGGRPHYRSLDHSEVGGASGKTQWLMRGAVRISFYGSEGYVQIAKMPTVKQWHQLESFFYRPKRMALGLGKFGMRGNEFDCPDEWKKFKATVIREL